MAQSRGRSITAVVLLVIGTLLLPVGIIGHWANRTFTDNERFVATLAPLTQSPEIQDAIAQTLTDSLVTTDSAAAQVKQWFPKAPDGLVNTVSSAVVTAVDTVALKLVSSPEFSTLWAKTSSEVQTATMALLNNEPPPSLSVQDGNLVLNLDVLRENVRAKMQAKGVNLPQVQTDAIPASVVIMEDTQIQQIRSIYSWASPLLAWFLILPIVLLVLSVLLRADKAKGLRWMGYATLIAAGLLAIFLTVGDSLLAPSLADTAFSGTQTIIWNTLTVYLAQATWITAGIGVLLMIIGAFWSWRRRRNQPQAVEVVEEVDVVEVSEA